MPEEIWRSRRAAVPAPRQQYQKLWNEEVAVAERRVTVGSRVGLHARPAAIFVQAAAKQPVKVTLGKEGKPAVDARSILSVLGMDIRGGEEVILTADGEGADQALDELAALVARDLDA